MARVMVKCVPDAEPDADGFWLNRRVPAWVLAPGLRGRFDLLTRHCAPAGHHVVKYRGTGRRKRTYVDPLGGLHHAVTLAARTFRALAPTVERAAEAIRVASREMVPVDYSAVKRRAMALRESRQDGGPMPAHFLYPYD